LDNNIAADFNKRIIVNNTEGNEAINPDVGNSKESSHCYSATNLLERDGLASEFEPYGSQRFQYNG